MGMGEGISGMAEGKTADWEDTVGDFWRALTTVGVGLSEASLEVPLGVCFRKKEAHCPFPGWGIQGVTGGSVLVKQKEGRERKGQKDSVDSR